MKLEREEKASLTPPTAQEVNNLYRKTQLAAAQYDFACECTVEGPSVEVTQLLEGAYDKFLAAVNARRVASGKSPYTDINDVPFR